MKSAGSGAAESVDVAGAAAAADSVDTAAPAYDPMKDPKRRAKSNDPGWKYGYWPEIGNRDKVKCIRCGMETSGGIKRLKEHLCGGSHDIVKCSKTTTEIAQEMRAYLDSNKRRRPIFLDDDSGQGQGQGEDGSECSIVKPSSGTAAKRRRAAFHFTRPAAIELRKEVGKVASMLRRTPEQIVDARRSAGPHQTTIEASIKPKADRNYVNEQWAMWFYECGTPFNAICSRQFQIACEATAQYGSGYVPPSFHDLREPLLNACVKKTSNMRAEHEIAWSTYCCGEDNVPPIVDEFDDGY